ncbi:Calcineurin-like metallo-phosphoesterase superfamily protein isoform 1 [Hibiscus syriacus]|uniref:Sulfotransferase n=2 Tax=Hibiscus syriacus TaxID=106335 RepID=A0A6A3CKX7_HIBSY|nr:Calcineurin-like metallo-phosphoesterase superfamily protein isoform 1 [Hibiscus syriacus]
MVSGVYICSIRLRVVTPHTDTKTQTDQKPQQCQTLSIERWEAPFIHFPNPKTFSREECVCNPVRYFVIMSMQRSGSGWFETLLNSHINVSSNGEIMGPSDRRRNASSILENLDKVYNLDWFTSASKNECSAAVGFKWMLNQGVMKHHEDVVEYFKRNGVSTIFLFRKNVLRRLVSLLANAHDKEAKLLNGTHKSHVHSPAEAQILAKYKPTINTTRLIPDLKLAEKETAKAIEYFNNTRHIVLYYEDLVKNRSKLREVQDFLRLPYRELRSGQVKIHMSPLSEQVANWDGVLKVLKNTSYDRFFYSDYKL